MKKLFSKSGWLVMAAALLTGMASCSSDEDTVQSTVEQKGSTIHVTVGAGIGNGDTRSLVSVDGTTRTLQFTTGDRLYVYGLIPGTDKYVVGFLNNITIDTDPTQATFSGDLSVYESLEKQPFTPSTYDGSANVLENASATLVHAAAVENVNYSIDAETKDINIIPSMATNAEALMTTCLRVEGYYNTTDGDFDLAPGSLQPIVNCTIVGAPVGDIKVTYLNGYDDSFTEYASNTFTRNNPGDLTFAFFGGSNSGHKIRIETAYGNKVLDLGTKILNTNNNSTVYPVTATWLPNVTNHTTDEMVSPYGDTYNFSSDCNITVSGYSGGYRYVFNGTNNTINLNGLVATNNSWGANCFDIIKESGSPTPNTTINVTGTNNHITCTNTEYTKAIDAQGEVLLKGEGALTITTKNSVFCGIVATNYTTSNNSNTTTTELDVTDLLAAPGYNVVRSKRTDNPDGTYTWTYTVFPFIAPATGHTVIPTPNSGITYVFSDNSEIALTGHTEKTKIELHGSYNIIEMTDFRAAITSEPAWGNFIDLPEQSNINNLQIKVMGNNSITCTRDDYAKPISANEVSDVRFIGNGTLTLTTKYKQTCGIFSGNNKPSNNNWETTDVSVDMTDMLGGIDSNSQRYTVVRSPRTDNGDGTYTWTYTVAPKNN